MRSSPHVVFVLPLLPGCGGGLFTALAEAMVIAALIYLAFLAMGALVELVLATLVTRRFFAGRRVEVPLKIAALGAVAAHGALAVDVLRAMANEGGRADRGTWIISMSLLLPVAVAFAALVRPRPPQSAAWYAQLGAGSLVTTGLAALLSSVLWPWTEVPDPPTGEVVALVDSAASTCVRTHLGEVACWGDNSSGQTGTGSRPRRRERPSLVPELGRVDQIVGGGSHTCALGERGLLCWGSNREGQLGPSLSEIVWSPTAIPELGPVVEVGNWDGATWARQRDGRLVGLGKTFLEGGSAGPHTLGWVSEDTVETVVGRGFWCARGGQGKLQCAQFGAEPVAVGQVAGDLVATEDEACALLDDGTVGCWEPRRVDAFSVAQEPVPMARVVGLYDVASIAATPQHRCAITRSGEVWCWGAGFRGQLGDGSADWHADAQHAEIPARALSLSLGEDLSCAEVEGGRMYCWGSAPPGAPPEAYTLCHETWLGDLWCVSKPALVKLLD